MTNTRRFIIRAVSMILAVALPLFPLASNGQPPRKSLTNPDYESFEASAIEFVVNGEGELFQVKADGCPRCPSELLLPKRDMNIVMGDSVLSIDEAVRYQGSFALVTVEHQTGMVMKVTLPEIVLERKEGLQ